MITLITAAFLFCATPSDGDAVAVATTAPAASAATATDKAEVTLVIGTGVEEREVVPYDDGKSPGAGDNVYAWMQLKGFDGDSVQQVWLRDGNVVARHTLSVGSSHRWRSWSHHRVSPGSYEVRLLGSDDSELAKQSFTVTAAQAR
jgi:Protein of unknown function (DUF2914)